MDLYLPVWLPLTVVYPNKNDGADGGGGRQASIYLSDFQVFVLRLPYAEQVVMIIIVVAMQVNKTTTGGETHNQADFPSSYSDCCHGSVPRPS